MQHVTKGGIRSNDNDSKMHDGRLCQPSDNRRVRINSLFDPLEMVYAKGKKGDAEQEMTPYWKGYITGAAMAFAVVFIQQVIHGVIYP